MLGVGVSLWRPAVGRRAFNPATLFASGEQGGWWDPSDLSTVFQDSAGTTPGAVGQPVGRILDKSGRGNHLIQATTAAKPILRSDGIELDGVDDHMVFPAAMLSGWTAGTALFAAKRAVDPPPSVAESGPVLGNFGSAPDSNHWPYLDGVVYEDFLSTTRFTAGDPGNMANWHVGEMASASGSFRVAFNGVNFYTAGTNTVGSGGGPILGKSGIEHFTGRIGRIIITNDILTAGELPSSRTYIAAGYGGTL